MALAEPEASLAVRLLKAVLSLIVVKAVPLFLVKIERGCLGNRIRIGNSSYMGNHIMHDVFASLLKWIKFGVGAAKGPFAQRHRVVG